MQNEILILSRHRDLDAAEVGAAMLRRLPPMARREFLLNVKASSGIQFRSFEELMFKILRLGEEN